ncbi:MAG TPA: tryptophan 7-halogenase [Thermoanaerobaculia bacterium]|nr:tryptophan 7-halogenase [Thermoanaerobaculia bacterium]
MAGSAVVVVGGGPAGAVCAALLARRGHEVVLVTDSRRRPSWPDVLSPNADAILERIGFPPDELAATARPCRGIVDGWHPGPPVYTDFQLYRFRTGWVVDRGSFDERLVRFAAGCGVRVCASSAPAYLTGSPVNLAEAISIRWPGVTGALTAAFVVDATGMAGRLLPTDYNRRLRYDRLIAVRISLTAVPDPPDWMHLAASPGGWWYTVSPATGPTQAVFMTDGDLLPRCPAARLRHLATEFREAFPSLSHGLTDSALAGPVAIRDARTTYRRRVWAGRWLPIGDAFASLDPLTGSGLERAFESAESGAERVSDYLMSGCFRRLQVAALNTAKAFLATLDELRRYYAMAVERRPQLNGLFWQRRAGL